MPDLTVSDLTVSDLDKGMALLEPVNGTEAARIDPGEALRDCFDFTRLREGHYVTIADCSGPDRCCLLTWLAPPANEAERR